MFESTHQKENMHIKYDILEKHTYCGGKIRGNVFRFAKKKEKSKKCRLRDNIFCGLKKIK